MNALRIAHISDIHIRGLNRHDEFKAVFEQFAKDARAQKADVIFVGGDVWHTKTSGITPESIDFMRWWLKLLADVAPVHIILGNHDGNLTNVSRQDAISPIVEALGDDRIFLYKKSGCYEFSPGYVWCVYSLFDREGWPTVKPVPGKFNIACYHGPVRSSVTETGWAIDDGPSVDFFDGYNLVLLGDIHRAQFLGHRETKDGPKPWIGYPSTPVCQNYAEGQQLHGYYMWDIKSSEDWDVAFRELVQPHPFVTVDWTGDIGTFSSSIVSLPVNARFRVKSDVYLTGEEVKKLTDVLKSKKNAREVVIRSEPKQTNDVFSAGGLEMMRDDLRNVDVQMLLLRDFYRNNEMTPTDWENVSTLVEAYLQKASAEEEAPRHAKWQIRDFAFDNLFTYGRDNKINFDSLNGIVGVFGPNRCGKSSIVGALMYGLFNASDRGSIKNLHLVNARKAYGEARITVTVNDTDYSIVRETAKNDTRRGETTAATSLTVEKTEKSGVTTPLTGLQRTDTERTIRSLIGSQDDFLLTSMSTQGDLTRLIDEGSSFRKLILTKFLDLDVFARMYELANKDAGAASASLKALPAKDWAAEVTKLSESLSKHVIFSAKVTEKIDDLRLKLDDIRARVAVCKNAAGAVSSEDLDRSRQRVSHLDKKRAQHFDSEKSLFKDIEKKEKELADLSERIKTVDIDALKTTKKNERTLESSHITLKHQWEREKQTLTQLEKSIKKLDVVPCGDKFPTCMFIKDSHADKLKIEEQRSLVGRLQEQLNELSESLAECTKVNASAKILAWERDVADRQSLNDSLSSQRLLHAREEGALKDASNQHQLENERLVELESQFRKSENNEISSLNIEAAKIQADIKKFEGMKLEAAAMRGRAESDMAKLEDQRERWTKLSADHRYFDLISNAFSRRGIPTRIINSQLPAINSVIAEILHGVVEYTVELEADEESNALDIYINYGDSRRIVELGSGMEKMFAALAIRVALWSVTSLPKTDIFIIDEGFGVLDDTQVEACNRLLMSLKKYFRALIVITHVDAVKDIVDSTIEISKNEKDSRVFVE